jgi:hypothetical protein
MDKMRVATSPTVKSLNGRPRPRRVVLSRRHHIEMASLAGLFALLIVAAGVSGWFVGLVNTRSARYGDAPAAPTINDFRVGAIMFVPTKGPTCDLYRFDNFTGRVEPDGSINCERKLNPDNADAFAPGTERVARMKAILNTFQK